MGGFVEGEMWRGKIGCSRQQDLKGILLWILCQMGLGEAGGQGVKGQWH